MYKAISFVAAVMLVAAFAAGADAGNQVLTFDANNWGTSVWGAYNTQKDFESSGGNPGACLLLKGFGGVGASFQNAGFTGDFAAAGYKKIAFDIKVVSWWPAPNQPAPTAYVFVRGSNTQKPWVKQVQGFAPVTTAWKRYAVDFEPNWSDSEANAHGWSILDRPGVTETAPFKNVIHNVFQSGMWIDVISGGAGCHILLDNYSLLSAEGAGSSNVAPLKIRPLKPIRDFHLEKSK